MDYSILIPESMGYYLDGFKKNDYPVCFRNYREQTEQIFRDIAQSDPRQCALGLVDWIDAHPGRFFRARRMIDRKMLMLQYTVPAAIQAGQTEFAKELCRCWKERHPEQAFRMGTYEELMKGFNNTLLGFPLPNKED